MFEELPPSTPTQKLFQAIYRWRGIDQWPIAEATVYSCEWIQGARNRPGYYIVTFSYRANGDIQQGSYDEDGSEDTSPFARGDKFPIKWNPKHPARFYTENASLKPVLAWVPIVIVATIVLVLTLFS